MNCQKYCGRIVMTVNVAMHETFLSYSQRNFSDINYKCRDMSVYQMYIYLSIVTDILLK